MKCCILIDNLAQEPLQGEWGLSFYIEYGGKRLLLDAGASGSFAENAKQLGIDLSQVDCAILSHAHYDHSDGMEAFFAQNEKAKLYLRACCRENCYSDKGAGPKYIGIRPGFLEKFAARLCYAEGDVELFPGVWLIPHKLPMEAQGRKIHMYTRVDGEFRTETFAHEQSLVLETPKGLVVFNSCCHGGGDNILREVSQTFPGRPLLALVGGLHLFRSGEAEILAAAQRLKDTGVGTILTGHCTGEAALTLLQQELGPKVQQLYAGFTVEFDESLR